MALGFYPYPFDLKESSPWWQTTEHRVALGRYRNSFVQERWVFFSSMRFKLDGPLSQPKVILLGNRSNRFEWA